MEAERARLVAAIPGLKPHSRKRIVAEVRLQDLTRSILAESVRLGL